MTVAAEAWRLAGLCSRLKGSYEEHANTRNTHEPQYGTTWYDIYILVKAQNKVCVFYLTTGRRTSVSTGYKKNTSNIMLLVSYVNVTYQVLWRTTRKLYFEVILGSLHTCASYIVLKSSDSRLYIQ